MVDAEPIGRTVSKGQIGCFPPHQNIYEEGELPMEGTVAKNAIVQIEGGREVVRDIEYYNLDLTISVGYRVNSHRGAQFCMWAT